MQLKLRYVALVPIKRESDQIGQNILNQGAAASAS